MVSKSRVIAHMVNDNKVYENQYPVLIDWNFFKYRQRDAKFFHFIVPKWSKLPKCFLTF